METTASHTVVRNFVPVFISRGVVQISAYIDAMLASLLPTGAVAALFNAQVLYTLPVSLFGMAVSAAELPAMSGIVAAETDAAVYLRDRLQRALADIAFWIVPSATAFLALGDVVAANAACRLAASVPPMPTTCGAYSRVLPSGLLASTMGRLYSSTFYALRDTRTPLRFAIVRVTLATMLGAAAALFGPRRRRHSGPMGRGRDHRGIQCCRMGGIHAAAPLAGSPHRPLATAPIHLLPSLELRASRGPCGPGSKAMDTELATLDSRGHRTRHVRRRVLRSGVANGIPPNQRPPAAL